MWSLRELLAYLGVAYHHMDDSDVDESLIKKAKTIITSPGIKPSHWLYKKYGKKIMSELSFLSNLQKTGYFPWRDNLMLIWVTGTNWKSTTTRWLYQSCLLLEKKKKKSDRKDVYIGGEFDVPLSWILLSIMKKNKTKKQSIIIVEASSFMLRALQEFIFDIGVLLNITPDHIDWHGSMKSYLNAKLNMLMYSRVSITLTEIKENAIKDQMRWISFLHRLRPFGSSTTSPKSWIEYSKIPKFRHPSFLWRHNAWNFWAIEAVLEELYPKLYTRDILQKIKPIAHRLSAIKLKNAIILYDDSVSGSSYALWAALHVMQAPVTLIAGWYNNGENYNALLELLETKVRVGVFYGETRAQLYPLAKQVVTNSYMVETLEEAIDLAIKDSNKLWIPTILYSPGAKCFDQFANVYERIQHFEQLIKQYQ